MLKGKGFEWEKHKRERLNREWFEWEKHKVEGLKGMGLSGRSLRRRYLCGKSLRKRG